MFTKLTEQNGCAVAEFTDVKRFTLAIIEDVKAELKPTLSNRREKGDIKSGEHRIYRQQRYRMYHFADQDR